MQKNPRYQCPLGKCRKHVNNMWKKLLLLFPFLLSLLFLNFLTFCTSFFVHGTLSGPTEMLATLRMPPLSMGSLIMLIQMLFTEKLLITFFFLSDSLGKNNKLLWLNVAFHDNFVHECYHNLSCILSFCKCTCYSLYEHSCVRHTGLPT